MVEFGAAEAWELVEKTVPRIHPCEDGPWMIPEPTPLPTGNEHGETLVLGVGGSTFRLSRISVPEMHMEVLANTQLPEDAKSNVFAWVAREFAARAPPEWAGPVQLSWSFPLVGGRLQPMGKGFWCPDHLVGQNLTDVFNKLLPANLRISTIVHDGVASLICGRFINRECRMALTLGTGINIAVDSRDSGVINTEVGMLGGAACPLPLPTWPHDVGMDDPIAALQPFEARVGGKYLGPLVSRMSFYNKSEAWSTHDVWRTLSYPATMSTQLKNKASNETSTKSFNGKTAYVSGSNNGSTNVSPNESFNLKSAMAIDSPEGSPQSHSKSIHNGTENNPKAEKVSTDAFKGGKKADDESAERYANSYGSGIGGPATGFVNKSINGSASGSTGRSISNLAIDSTNWLEFKKDNGDLERSSNGFGQRSSGDPILAATHAFSSNTENLSRDTSKKWPGEGSKQITLSGPYEPQNLADVSGHEASVVNEWHICDMVARRAAHLVAAALYSVALALVVSHDGPQRIVVACTGGVVLEPEFNKRLLPVLEEMKLKSGGLELCLVPEIHGSEVGAAIAGLTTTYAYVGDDDRND